MGINSTLCGSRGAAGCGDVKVVRVDNDEIDDDDGERKRECEFELELIEM